MRKGIRDALLSLLAAAAIAGSVYGMALGAQAAAPVSAGDREFTPQVRGALLTMVNQECTNRSTTPTADDQRVTACDTVTGDAIAVTPPDWELMYDDTTDTWFWNHKSAADMKAWH